MNSLFEDMITAIVRPPRAHYTDVDLGPLRLRCRGVEYKREDFEVCNDRGHRLRASLWVPYTSKRNIHGDFCILYLHPNSGSRVDVVKTKIMAVAAQTQCAVCSFDFSGCGRSDGDHISLGVREKDDACYIIAELINRGFDRFLLWGRSMGAATSVMLYGAYKGLLRGVVQAMLLDSPFTSFQGLADEYMKAKINLPKMFLSPAINYLKRMVETKYNFDLLQMSPISAAHEVDVLTIVLSGKADKIVPPNLSLKLYTYLSGPKIRVYFEGGHNTHRPPEIFEAIVKLIHGALDKLTDAELLNGISDFLLDIPSREPPETPPNTPVGSSPRADASLVNSFWPATADSQPSTPKAASVVHRHHHQVRRVSEPTVQGDTIETQTSVVLESNRPGGSTFLSTGDYPSEEALASDLERKAEKAAAEASAALSNLLKIKDVNALTQDDIHVALALKAQSDIDEAAQKAVSDPISWGVEVKIPRPSTPHAATPSESAATVASASSASSDKQPADHQHHHQHHPSVPGTAVTSRASITNAKKPNPIIDVTCDYPDISDVSTSTTMCAKSPQPQSYITASANATSTLYDAGSSLLGVLSFGYLGSYSSSDSSAPTPPSTSDTSAAGGDAIHINKYIGDFCPPNPEAWNTLASARAISIVMDLVCSQTISTAVTLLSRSGDIRSVKAPNGTMSFIRPKLESDSSTLQFNEMSDLQKDLFLSMIIAELAAEFGSPSLAGDEGASWVRAFNSSRDFTSHGKSRSAGPSSHHQSHQQHASSSMLQTDAGLVAKKVPMISSSAALYGDRSRSIPGSHAAASRVNNSNSSRNSNSADSAVRDQSRVINKGWTPTKSRRDGSNSSGSGSGSSMSPNSTGSRPASDVHESELDSYRDAAHATSLRRSSSSGSNSGDSNYERGAREADHHASSRLVSHGLHGLHAPAPNSVSKAHVLTSHTQVHHQTTSPGTHPRTHPSNSPPSY